MILSERSEEKMLSLLKKHICVLVTISLLFMLTACGKEKEYDFDFDTISEELSGDFSYVSHLNIAGNYSKQGNLILYADDHALKLFSLTTKESYTILEDHLNWYFEKGYIRKCFSDHYVCYVTLSWMNLPGNMYCYDINTRSKVQIPVNGNCVGTYMIKENKVYIVTGINDQNELLVYNIDTGNLKVIANGHYSDVCFTDNKMFFYDDKQDSISSISLSDNTEEVLFENQGKYTIQNLIVEDGKLYFLDNLDILKYDLSSKEILTIQKTDGVVKNKDLRFWVYGDHIISCIHNYRDDYTEVNVLNLSTGKTMPIITADNGLLHVEAYDDAIIMERDDKVEVYLFSGELLAAFPY